MLAALFMVSNAAGSPGSACKLGFAYYGYGFTYASLISLLAGAWVLEWSMRQPGVFWFSPSQKAF
jgi:uncharacterized membrane protein